MQKTFARVGLALAATVVVALALAACGGSSDTTSTSSSSSSPEDVTKAFLTAIAAGDGEQACSYASANAITTVEQSGGKLRRRRSPRPPAASATRTSRTSIRRPTRSTDQSDTSATVKVTKPDGQSDSFKLIMEDGSWKIDQ